MKTFIHVPIHFLFQLLIFNTNSFYFRLCKYLTQLLFNRNINTIHKSNKQYSRLRICLIHSFSYYIQYIYFNTLFCIYLIMLYYFKSINHKTIFSFFTSFFFLRLFSIQFFLNYGFKIILASDNLKILYFINK